MRISVKRRIGRFKVSFVVGTITPVSGVNSQLHDGKHVLMWDFDSTDLAEVRQWLMQVQARYGLPAIHVSQSSIGGGYHAYSLTRLEWLESIHIVSGTKGIDPRYVSMCAMRGHWTLRLSDKGNGVPTFVGTLPSGHQENVTPQELTSWVNYEVWSTKRVLTLGKRGL